MTKSLLQVILQASLATSGAWAHIGLLVVDVQDCFLEKDTSTGKQGSLSVPASHIIPVINKIREKDCLFDVVVRTRDFHPPNHISFGSTHGLAPFSHLNGKGGLPITCVKPATAKTVDASCCPTQHIDPSKVDCTKQLCPPQNFTWSANNSAFVSGSAACTQCKADPASCFDDVQLMWTDHCLQDGDSTIPPSLMQKDSDVVLKKGTNVFVDAYSAFMDNSRNLKTDLDEILQKHQVDVLYVAGIATDVCVRWTVEDALSNRTSPYEVRVISDASAGLAVGTTPTQLHEDALKAMEALGARIVTSEDVLNLHCHGHDDEPESVSGTYQTRGLALALGLAASALARLAP